MRFLIDIYQIEILECVQEPLDREDRVQVVDLTTEVEGSKPPHQFGGRFWILADEEEDDDDQPVSSDLPPSRLDLGIPVSLPNHAGGRKKSV